MTANPPTRLTTLRHISAAMLDGRDESQLRRQVHPELSPLLWHVGHVFFVENYWIAERVFGDTTITDAWRSLYFPEACHKGSRGARLPGPAAMREWIVDVAAHSDRYWRESDDTAHRLLDDGYLLSFVCQHYAQHLETMRMAAAQLLVAEKEGPASVFDARRTATPSVTIDAQRVTLGTSSIEAYDNEQPPVDRTVECFDIAAAPVDNAQYLAFIEDDGYHRAEFWDEAGWQWRRQHSIVCPQHWRPTDNGWRIPDIDGRLAHGQDPVHGLSWYEARAFARYADARLPLEAEWETAMRSAQLTATGQVWEWCADAFSPYPGFRAFPYDGYSKPWFDGQHFVARGSSRYTETDIVRPGFRNFYPPTHRHVFAGLRLAG